jgi:hypothetical protein
MDRKPDLSTSEEWNSFVMFRVRLPAFDSNLCSSVVSYFRRTGGGRVVVVWSEEDEMRAFRVEEEGIVMLVEGGGV